MDYSHRMGKCRILITDHAGEPLRNKTVHVNQTEQQFLFGCGAFPFLPFTDPDFMPDKKDFFKDITDKWLDVYNYGTLPFYWGNFEPEEGKPRTELLMRSAEYLKARNVKVKGHPLCWHTVCADWLMEYDNDTIFKKQIERIHRDVTDFKGVIDMWDVINEVVIMPIFDKYDNAVTRICKDKGRVGLIREVFKAAKESNPDSILLLNDFNTSISYEILIDGCLEAGIPIDVIGIQSHQHQGYWGAEKIEEVLERFEHFGLPIHFTENTLVSGSLIPEYIEDLNDWQVEEWPSTPEGEERQAKQMEEMYRILYSHPLVEAITGWDFTDGAWLKAPSGVIHFDGTIKPAYNMLKKLIKEEWRTECDLETDENGYVTLEGYLGKYAINLNDEKAEFILEKNSKEGSVKLS